MLCAQPRNGTFMTAPLKTPYDLFAAAIAAGIQPTVHDCWIDFAYWERARYFADDPSHPAKAAIDWVYSMEGMRGALNEFQGAAKSECLAALDTAYEAFAKLKHSAELIHAVEIWIETRKSQ